VATLSIHGKNIIGSDLSSAGQATFRGNNPRQASAIEPAFHEASTDEIARAAELAEKAATIWQQVEGVQTARFLEAIGEEIVALGDTLLERANEETALGIERLRYERDRTVNQFRLFANVVREGSWVDARIDTPNPERKPIPKPGMRRMLQPLGPVAVFGASNFPLAFSVAGGDTASALAARNPVIVKAHPAHPGTSELVGSAIAQVVAKESLPPGTFSLLHGVRPEVSIALVTDPHIKAVAFTGSLRAGRALFDAAAKRPEPIPVFSEMGSVNPMFLLPGALEGNPQSLAEGFFRSVTLGTGQYCTCPGLAFAVKGKGLDTFLELLAKQFEQGAPATMLTGSIAKTYADGFARVSQIPGVTARLASRASDAERAEGRPGMLVTTSEAWLGHKELHQEIFGPSTVIVRCESTGDMIACAGELEGSLTAALHGDSEELRGQRELLRILQNKAGRILFNSYPTGLEVGYATHHGGPYPATTDPRFTSVGEASIYRFARPVCYQNFPDYALPVELRNANPLGIWRTVDGKLTKDTIA